MGMVLVSLDKSCAKMHRNMTFNGRILVDGGCIGSCHFGRMEGCILVACCPVVSRAIIIPRYRYLFTLGVDPTWDSLIRIPFVKTVPLARIQIVLSRYLWEIFNAIFDTVEVMAIPEIHQVIKSLSCHFCPWPTRGWIDVIALVEQDLGIDSCLLIGFQHKFEMFRLDVVIIEPLDNERSCL